MGAFGGGGGVGVWGGGGVGLSSHEKTPQMRSLMRKEKRKKTKGS